MSMGTLADRTPIELPTEPNDPDEFDAIHADCIHFKACPLCDDHCGLCKTCGEFVDGFEVVRVGCDCTEFERKARPLFRR